MEFEILHGCILKANSHYFHFRDIHQIERKTKKSSVIHIKGGYVTVKANSVDHDELIRAWAGIPTLGRNTSFLSSEEGRAGDFYSEMKK